MSLLQKTHKLLLPTQLIIGQITAMVPQNLQRRRQVHRWVMPTLRVLKKREEKMNAATTLTGTHKLPPNRTTFSEWNYPAEIYAFGKRLHEQFDLKLLQQAFVQRSYIVQEELKQQQVGIEKPETNLNDNKLLIEIGEKMIGDYIDAFVSIQLPRFPIDGRCAIRDYLLSDELLANVSKHIGATELILTTEYPVEQHTLANTLKAVVAALSKSTTATDKYRVYDFIRDFICTQLNQLDINDLWEINKPIERLNSVCEQQQLGTTDVRLLETAGQNTILAVYNVGIYFNSNKRLLASGFGETATIAHEMAARNALKKLYGTHNHRPFDYKISSKELFKAVNQDQEQQQVKQ